MSSHWIPIIKARCCTAFNPQPASLPSWAAGEVNVETAVLCGVVRRTIRMFITAQAEPRDLWPCVWRRVKKFGALHQPRAAVWGLRLLRFQEWCLQEHPTGGYMRFP